MRKTNYYKSICTDYMATFQSLIETRKGNIGRRVVGHEMVGIYISRKRIVWSETGMVYSGRVMEVCD